jgi:hypothetical protein
MAIGAVAAAALSAARSAEAQTVTLFTTQDDFTGWANSGPVVSNGPTNTYDSDGSTTNGYGNTTNPGGTAVVGAGSLQINTGSNAIGYTYTAFSPNELNNQSFMNLIDPGSVGGTTVAYSGTMYMTYTVPSFVGPDVYYQFGIDLAYPGSGYYSPYFETSLTPATTVDGLSTVTATIPYTIKAGSGGSFTISPFLNAGVYGSGVSGTSNVMTAPFYIDDIAVSGTPPLTFSDATASWVTNGSSNWETAANWSSSPAIPGGVGSQITFDNNGGAITANPTVTLSNPVSATLLTFGNASGGPAVNYMIASGAPAASIAVSTEIDADSGTHAINVPVSGTGVNFYFGIASGASLALSNFTDTTNDSITVTNPLSNQPGGGTLSLSATLRCNLTVDDTAVTFLSGSSGFIFGLNVNTGSVVNLGANTWNTNSIGSDGTGEIIVPTGGILYTGEYSGNTVTYSGTFGGGGSIVVGEGGSTNATPSTLALYGNNSTFTGTITAGSTSAAGAYTLAVGSANSLGGGSVILDGGILQAIGGFIGTQNVVVTANGGTVDTDGPGVGANGTAITLGAISSTATGAMLSKINTGILTTTSIRGVGLSISGGTSGAASTVQIAQNNGTLAGAQAGVSVLTSLTIENTGSYTSTLDLTNNSLIVRAGTGVAAGVLSEIESGRNNNFAGGLWTGTGITSSLAAAKPTLTAVGMIVNDNGSGQPLVTTFEGQTVADGDVLVKYTYVGDALLTGHITASDYVQIDNAFNNNSNVNNTPLTGWYNGDFNYDGVVNGDDYSLIDNAYNSQESVTFDGTSAGPAEVASDTEQVASPAVPEPTTLTLIGLGAGGLMVRRRRRN